MKQLLKRHLNEQWRGRLHRLSRLRWITKYRILRGAGESPLRHLRYVVLDPEVESYTFRVANVDEMLSGIAEVTGAPLAELEGYVTEAQSDPELSDRLARRLRWRFDVKRRPQLGNRLGWYALMRALRPSLVIETGVYHGLGSLTLLRAIERNREEGVEGRLISFDRSPEAGWIVNRSEHPDWRIVRGPTNETLERAIGDRRVGALFHDTDHTEENRLLEFGAALQHAASELLLVDSGAGRFPTLARLAREHGGTYRRVPLRAADHWYQNHALAFAVFRDPSSREPTELNDVASAPDA